MAKKVSKKTKKSEELPQAFETAPVKTEPYLTRDEQLALEDSTSNVEKARLSLSLAEQVTVNKGLELQLADRALKDAKMYQNQKEAEYGQRRKIAGELISKLKEKYGVKGDFAYDPLSGRIGNE